MNPPLRIIDGSKAAGFDGLFLEVSGVSGSSDSKRIAINLIDAIVVAPAGDELMLVVKSHKGGFGAVISAEKKAEWDQLVEEVNKARAALGATS